MGQYKAGQWIPFSVPHGGPPIGKPQPPPRKKTRDTKPKRRKRRKRT